MDEHDDEADALSDFLPDPEEADLALARAEASAFEGASILEELRAEELETAALADAAEHAKVLKREACLDCEGWHNRPDDPMLCCDARLTRRKVTTKSGRVKYDVQLCNRMRHVACAALAGVPDGKWFCSEACARKDEAYAARTTRKRRRA